MSGAQSAVERLAEQWNQTRDWAPTPYDQGRVDQRHDMTAQLLEAIEADRVRAGVVAEESEWEVGVSYSTPSAPSIDGYRMRSYMKVDSVEKAQEFAALVERPMIQKRTKAVPAGEWVSVPVKQEGADDA